MHRIVLKCVLLLLLVPWAVSAQIMEGNTYKLTTGGVTGGGGQSGPGAFRVTATIPFDAAGFAGGDNQRLYSGVIGIVHGGDRFIIMPVGAHTGMPAHDPGLSFTLRYSGGAGAVTGSFYHRQGGETNWDEIPMTPATGEQMSVAVPPKLLGIRGLEYYFTLDRSGAGATADDAGEPFWLEVFLSNAQGQRPTALPDASYRMVSLPIDAIASPSVPSVFADDLGTADNTQWRLGRWDANASAYVEYPNSGNVAPGKAYWLIAKGAKKYGAPGISVGPDYVALDGTKYHRVPLQMGWNQIGSPYAFAVDWSAVRFDDNGTVKGHDGTILDDVIYAYNGTAYATASQLKPWEGVFVYIKRADVDALVPFTEATGSGKVAPKATASQPLWQVELRLESGGKADVANYAGVYADAVDGEDSYDLSEPPGAPGTSTLAFRLAELETRLRRCDYRAPFEDGATWQIEISTGEARTLAATGIEALPDSFEAWLILDIGPSIRLEEGRPVDLPTDVESAELVIGTQAFARGMVAAALPDSYALSQNFPNPFNPSSTIRFALPADQHVTLEVYNILGQRVVGLIDGLVEAGHHAIVWDGRDDSNSLVASGIYFYRIQAGSFSASRKMMLLK